MIVTPLYAGILAVLFFVLSMRVVKLRGHDASFGDGGNPMLLHAYALSFSERFRFGRYWGTALTFGLRLVCGVLCLYQGLRAAAL